MNSLINISEAASLALHTTVLLAHNGGQAMSAKQMAARLQVSEAHLSKVMQRLGKAGLVDSRRGPGGGFTLAVDPAQTTLLKVFEATEGPMSLQSCLCNQPVCTGDCLLGDLLMKLGRLANDYLSGTRLSDLGHVYKEMSHEEVA